MLPVEKAGKMPEASQACTMGWKKVSVGPPPHELLMMWGRRSGRGLLPFRSVGASIHWPAASRAPSVQNSSSQPLAVIHRTSGATPI